MLVTGVVVLAVDRRGPRRAGRAPASRPTSRRRSSRSARSAAFVALVVGLLEPVERKQFIASTAARFAAAAGGTKATPQQA